MIIVGRYMIITRRAKGPWRHRLFNMMKCEFAPGAWALITEAIFDAVKMELEARVSDPRTYI